MRKRKTGRNGAAAGMRAGAQGVEIGKAGPPITTPNGMTTVVRRAGVGIILGGPARSATHDPLWEGLSMAMERPTASKAEVRHRRSIESFVGTGFVRSTRIFGILLQGVVLLGDPSRREGRGALVLV